LGKEFKPLKNGKNGGKEGPKKGKPLKAEHLKKLIPSSRNPGTTIISFLPNVERIETIPPEMSFPKMEGPAK